MNSTNSFHPTLVKLETTRGEHVRNARRAVRIQRSATPAETATAKPRLRRMPFLRRARTA